MLIFIFVAALFKFSSTTPLAEPIDNLNSVSPISLTIFSRDIPIPECIHPERYRTLQGIIWSCVATIFACTWASMHPNVPDPLKSGWTNFRWRAITFFYAVLCPEFVTIWALRQWCAAGRHEEKYNTKPDSNLRRALSIWEKVQGWFCDKQNSRGALRQQRHRWTRTHGFLLEMHGLVVVDQTGKPFNRISPDQIVREILPDNLSREPLIDYYSNNGTGAIFDVSQLPEDFDIAEEEIKDKSKRNFFTGLVALVQSAWFIVQCIVRWVKHLHVTELEVVTLAFAFLNIMTYIFWWNKPQNMDVAIRVRVEREREDEEIADHMEEERDPYRGITFLMRLCQLLYPDLRPRGENESWFSYIVTLSWSQSRILLGRPGLRPRGENESWVSYFPALIWPDFHALKTPFDPLVVMLGGIITSDALQLNKTACVMFFSSERGIEQREIALVMALVGIFFGGVHLIPFWLSSFPSIWERYLWVACATWIIIEPSFLVGSRQVSTNRIQSWAGNLLGRTPIIGLIESVNRSFAAMVAGEIWNYVSLGLVLYVIARGILIYLAFFSLRSLPPDAFRNIPWSTFVPHF